MTREEIIEKVISTLSEEFEVEQEVITPDAVIYDTLQLDSLALLIWLLLFSIPSRLRFL